MQSFLKLFVLLFLVSGCAVVPTTRDYYRPIVGEGQVEVASIVCGYQRTKYDGIEQTLDSRSVRVFPKVAENGNVEVSVEIAGPDSRAVPIAIQLYDDKGQVLGKSEQPHLKVQSQYDGGLYRSYYVASFPIATSDQLTDIEILLKDKDNKVLVFKFERTVLADVLFASINC
ncbi:hypothetical protein [Vibrio caribbeanicus]|uniref:hypothetical protein n=1 Tax=Vibrio caribbeanicus TaxID=701175 RepID=UPI002283FD6D|nr:hypothetical protein [Vibrio caribbeanicus]MCY9843980.1 hypothetical protein [Vibrio caribbeanicus]